jgi:hypothetical protein
LVSVASCDLLLNLVSVASCDLLLNLVSVASCDLLLNLSNAIRHFPEWTIVLPSAER